MELSKVKTDLGNNGFPVSLNYFSALPDVNYFPSASLAVIFKSLMKKDSKTKERSLEDFIKAFDDSSMSQDLQSTQVVEAWIQLYPKLAFDNSRTVRLLVHKIQSLFLKAIGGKAFSKYLKSSLPIWLLSIYDGDKAVSSQGLTSLMECFDNDEEKVNQKIWKIFITEILNFIEVSLTLETLQTLSDERSTNADDATAKKERLTNSSIQMLNKVVTLVNDETDFNLSKEQFEAIEEILDNDNLWSSISTSFSPKTFNSSLCNSLLVLLKSLFQEQKGDQSAQNKFCTSTSSARSLYKHISKRFFKNVFKSTQSNQRVLFGSVILQFWSTLVVLTRFSQLEGKKKPKENIWEIVSNSDSKLLKFLSFGPCNLNSIYFTLIQSFLKILYSNTKELFSLDLAKNITNSILSSYSQWSLDYKTGAILCVTAFIEQLPKDWQEAVLTESTAFIVDFKAPRMGRSTEASKKAWIQAICSFLKLLGPESCHTVFSNYTDNILKYCKTNKESVDVANYINILWSLNESEEIQDLVSKLIELSSEAEDPNVISRIIESLIAVMQCNQLPSEIFEEISDFTATIGQLLEKETINVVNRFVFAAWDIPDIVKNIDNFELIDDILTKYEMIQSDSSSFIEAVLNKFKYTYDDCKSSDLLIQYFDNLKLKSKSEDDWSVLFNYFDENSLNDAISNLADEERVGFIKNFNNHKTQFIQLDSAVAEKVGELLQISWKNPGLGKGFINSIRESSMNYLIAVSLWDYIKSVDLGENIDVCMFTDLTPKEIDLLFELVDSDLINIKNIDKSQISLSNSIGANIHLVENSDDSSMDEVKLLGACYVFSKCILNHPFFTYYCGILGQYLLDFIFTMDIEKYSADELLELQTSLSSKFVVDADLQEIVEIICFKEMENSDNRLLNLLKKNLTDLRGAYSSYNARILKMILESKAETVSIKEFDNFTHEFNHLLKEPLKLLVVLSGLHMFLKSAKFDRIRNYVAAEILGVRNDTILTSGLKWVVLCLNFLDAQDESMHAIPPNRLNMVLAQFDKWLDSDISYDDSFLVIRSQLIKFMSKVESSQTQEAIIERLLEDNLSMIPMHCNHELMYFTLKFLSTSTLNKQDELIDILFDEELNKNLNKQNNMVTNMCQDALERCFKNVEFKQSESNLDKFYGLILENKFIQVKRICLKYLEGQITSKQQDLVINYQFKKSEDSNDLELNLPSNLMNYVKTFDANKFSEVSHITFYVAWYLILLQFKDINFQIRNEYIAEIKNSHLLSKFLDFIFVNQEIDNIRIIDGFDNFDLDDKGIMATHLYFLACKYLGSEVQSWFKELRNVQLKNDVDKFTTTKISTILIDDMFGEVELGKSKLTTDVMNIKINKIIHEVKCVFEIDEQTMEMVIKIPHNFPLSNVSVEGPKRIGLKENQWKAWLLSSQRVMSLTNGSIIEAIEVFKRNVDLHFSGFEECAICYSILHQDHSLPSKSCSTCNNKFHAACLYKWFKSSGSSSCPLCRQTFNFRK